MGKLSSRREPRAARADTGTTHPIVASVRADLAANDAAAGTRGACLRIAQLASELDGLQDVSAAVFAEESGLALVLHRGQTRRQLTFEIAPDNRHAQVIAIDEHMRRTARSIDLSDADPVRESLEWLIQPT